MGFLNWFKKKCPVCGMEVKDGQAVSEGGYQFCSQEHAAQFKEKQKQAADKFTGGGCCGGH